MNLKLNSAPDLDSGQQYCGHQLEGIILVAGLRHRTASLNIREQVAFQADEVGQVLQALNAQANILEAALLTTCNRTEFFVVATSTQAGLTAIQQFLKTTKGFDWKENRSATFVLSGEDAAQHLLRVASGLDSLILGEDQILAQVKEAHRVAVEVGTVSTQLDRLFKAALTTGKRVRNETGIASRDISVSRAAYEFVKQSLPNLTQKSIAVVGGGKMAEIILQQLQQDGAHQASVAIINRSQKRLKALSQQYGFPGYTWEDSPRLIQAAEVVFVATGAPHIILACEDFPEAAGRKVVVDISVPRNVDPKVDGLNHITLYNTDDLAGVSDLGLCDSKEVSQVASQTEHAAEAGAALLSQIQQIIDEESHRFQQWQRERATHKTISDLRAQMDTIRAHELEAFCEALQTGVQASQSPGELAALAAHFSQQLVNKLLHEPTIRLKAMAADNAPGNKQTQQVTQVLHQLFNLQASLQATQVAQHLADQVTWSAVVDQTTLELTAPERPTRQTA